MSLDFIIQYGPGIGLIGLMLWNIYDKRNSGVGELRKEIDNDYKIRKEQQDGKIEELKVELIRLSEKIVALEATLTEKDNHIKSLTKILQGRNPEVLALLEAISKNQKEESDHRKSMQEQNRKILNYQTKLLEKNQGRSERVDEASSTHTGDPMRVPEKKS